MTLSKLLLVLVVVGLTAPAVLRSPDEAGVASGNHAVPSPSPGETDLPTFSSICPEESRGGTERSPLVRRPPPALPAGLSKSAKDEALGALQREYRRLLDAGRLEEAAVVAEKMLAPEPEPLPLADLPSRWHVR